MEKKAIADSRRAGWKGHHQETHGHEYRGLDGGKRHLSFHQPLPENQHFLQSRMLTTTNSDIRGARDDDRNCSSIPHTTVADL